MNNYAYIPENDYLLLTPGPLSTTKSVRAAMFKDLCTWDTEYKELVQDIRKRLITELVVGSCAYTSVLMQGSGTFVVESVITSVVSQANAKLLVLVNGVYGERIFQIATKVGLNVIKYDVGEQAGFANDYLINLLTNDHAITHVAFVHCETTTGRMNDLVALAKIIKAAKKTLIVDAMSSLGGVSIDVAKLDIDFIISSANKCIQGVPGFGFVIAKQEQLIKCEGVCKSLSLDLFDQWITMEQKDPGKWRYTSPTHTVRAFHQALLELEQEGGVKAREQRYRANHRVLINGMRNLGFTTLVPEPNLAPIITTFLYPKNFAFNFAQFYQSLKQDGFVIYPGKVTNLDTFRIGNIGHVFPEDIERLVGVIAKLIK